MGMKERTRQRRGETPQRVGGAKREECSRPHLRDHTTAVHKVGKTPSCSVFLLSISESNDSITSEGGAASYFCLFFRFSREEASAAVCQKQV